MQLPDKVTIAVRVQDTGELVIRSHVGMRSSLWFCRSEDTISRSEGSS